MAPKSNRKLVFQNMDDLYHFSMALFIKLDSFQPWLRDCNFFSRKNVLYVNTCNYTCIDNFLDSYARKQRYNYELINLK